MKKNKPFSIRARARNFKYAFAGIENFFKSEHNALIHLLATVAIIFLAIIYHVSRAEMITLIFAVGFVWAAELFNTSIEKMMDHLSPGKQPAVQFIKDVAAAAVLVAVFTALVTGLIVFIPKIL